MGCLTWGDGSINGISISSLIKDFRNEIKLENLHIEEITYDFIDFLKNIIGDSKNINVGFLIAGYTENKDEPEMYVIEIKKGKIEDAIKLKNDDFSISWFGDYDFLSRFIFGIDAQMDNILKKRVLMKMKSMELSNFQKKS